MSKTLMEMVVELQRMKSDVNEAVDEVLNDSKKQLRRMEREKSPCPACRTYGLKFGNLNLFACENKQCRVSTFTLEAYE